MNRKVVQMSPCALLSVCIPAHNEEGNIAATLDSIASTLERHRIPYEFVIANDNSTDKTEQVIRQKIDAGLPITLVNRRPPGGFGRAIRSCLDNVHGEVVVIVMADHSDEPEDIVKYYHKINEGYDAVFGSRFRPGAVVKDYPWVKLIANRFGNKLLQLLFRTRHNDLTNAFKAFRTEALRSLMPFYASHFNITIEISITMLTRGFRIAEVPVNWYGRTWGRANFSIKELGRRYVATLAKLYAERLFIQDDVLKEHQVQLERVKDERPTEEEVISSISYGQDTHNWRSRVRRI